MNNDIHALPCQKGKYLDVTFCRGVVDLGSIVLLGTLIKANEDGNANVGRQEKYFFVILV